MKEIETRLPLDMLWDNIIIQYTAIVRAQRIMFVEGKEEMIKELKKRKYEIHDTGTKEKPNMEQIVTEEEFEFQFSWDRHATFLSAQSRAMSTLQGMLVKYEEMCRQEKADEEQQLRLDKLRAELDKLKGGGKNPEAENWADALMAVAERRKAMKANVE